MCLLSHKGHDLLFLYKLNDTIYAYRFAGLCVNEDIRSVHIFEIQTFVDIVHTFTFSVITKAFCCN